MCTFSTREVIPVINQCWGGAAGLERQADTRKDPGSLASRCCIGIVSLFRATTFLCCLPNSRIIVNQLTLTQDLDHILRCLASKFIIQIVAQNFQN
jgi:hypothetical protein